MLRMRPQLQAYLDTPYTGCRVFAGKSAVVQTAIVPSAAMLLQRACSGAAGVRGSIAGVPLHFLAPAVGVVFSGISGLIPYRA